MRPGQFYVPNNPAMENHIKLTPGNNGNSYLRHFQVAQLNLYLFMQEEELNRKRFKREYTKVFSRPRLKSVSGD
jgi:hypothetical protein